MIRAVGLHRSYGPTAAVIDASVTVEEGEVVALLGPNGAGKTTMLRMLLGLTRPDRGSVDVDRAVGHLPERFAAYDALSVKHYLRYMARARRVDQEVEVQRVVEQMDLADLLGRPVGRLSRGQHQRVGWAQALLVPPPCAYLLDEPTQGLDPAQVVGARRMLREAAEAGAAVVFSTHLLAEAAAVCDRIVVMVGGRIVADEPVGDPVTLEERFLRLVGGAQLT